MTKAQDFAARANLVSVPADAEPKPDAAAPAVRLAPVKMTVELDHAAYQFVRNFPDVMGIPAAVGKVRVPTVEVFRAYSRNWTRTRNWPPGLPPESKPTCHE
jgi:hypothetical protein